MTDCDDATYEVTIHVPVTLVVRAKDRLGAEFMAFAETGAWRRFGGKKFSVGFPTEIEVKEIGQPAAKAD